MGAPLMQQGARGKSLMPFSWGQAPPQQLCKCGDGCKPAAWWPLARAWALCNAPPAPRTPSQTTSGAAATSERLHKETELAIQQVHSDVAAAKTSVVDMLVKYATTVQG